MRPQEIHPTTVVINRKQKITAKKARHDALVWLEQTFPEIFNTELKIRPLKIGIMQDILDYVEKNQITTFSKSKLREAVVVFTRRVDYLASLKARERRVDLAGNLGVEVTEEEAERAAQKIKKRVEKSAKNARRITNVKPAAVSKNPAYPKIQSPTGGNPDFSPFYNSNPAYNPGLTPRASSPAVTVKHKNSRAYDPHAVARLKEKLGLSRRKEGSDELVEE